VVYSCGKCVGTVAGLFQRRRLSQTRRLLADAWNIANVLLYNDRDTMMVDKVVRDFAGEQFPDGYIPAVSPRHRLADADPSRRIPE
jgi:hypothetical protein